MPSKLLTIMIFAILAGGLAGCGAYERGEPAPVENDARATPTPGEGGVLSFESNIHPLLENRCSQCHGPNSSTAFTLSGDPTTDLATVSGLINTSDPEASRLLQKGGGLTTHGGGGVLDPSSDDYQAILSWIEEGAPQ